MGDTMSPNSLLEVPPSLSNLSLWLPLGPHLLSPALPDSSIQILILLSFGEYSMGCPFPLWSRPWFYTSSFSMHRLPENSILQVCPPRTHTYRHLLSPQSFGLTVSWKHRSASPQCGSIVSMAFCVVAFVKIHSYWTVWIAHKDIHEVWFLMV